MKQIVDKLNKIAKKIDESVEIPQTDLIIDSLDAITKAYGGTPNDSNLIVDKLEDIYNNIGSGGGGGGDSNIRICTVTAINNDTSALLWEISGDMNGMTLINNCIFNGVKPIEAGETETVTYAIQIDNDTFDPPLYYACYYVEESTVVITDMVNCKVSENMYYGRFIEVIDPTQDCSFTATKPEL